MITLKRNSGGLSGLVTKAYEITPFNHPGQTGNDYVLYTINHNLGTKKLFFRLKQKRTSDGLEWDITNVIDIDSSSGGAGGFTYRGIYIRFLNDNSIYLECFRLSGGDGNTEVSGTIFALE